MHATGSTVPSARRAKGLQFSRELAAIAMHFFIIAMHFSIIAMHFSIIAMHFSNIAMHFSNIAVHFSNIAVHYGGNVQEKQIFLLHFSRFFVTL